MPRLKSMIQTTEVRVSYCVPVRTSPKRLWRGVWHLKILPFIIEQTQISRLSAQALLRRHQRSISLSPVPTVKCYHANHGYTYAQCKQKLKDLPLLPSFKVCHDMEERVRKVCQKSFAFAESEDISNRTGL